MSEKNGSYQEAIEDFKADVHGTLSDAFRDFLDVLAELVELAVELIKLAILIGIFYFVWNLF